MPPVFLGIILLLYKLLVHTMSALLFILLPDCGGTLLCFRGQPKTGFESLYSVDSKETEDNVMFHVTCCCLLKCFILLGIANVFMLLFGLWMVLSVPSDKEVAACCCRTQSHALVSQIQGPVADMFRACSSSCSHNQAYGATTSYLFGPFFSSQQKSDIGRYFSQITRVLMNWNRMYKLIFLTSCPISWSEKVSCFSQCVVHDTHSY